MKFKDWINFSQKILYKNKKNIFLSYYILEYLLNKNIEYIIINDNLNLNNYNLYKLNNYLNMIINGFPIQYITKSSYFWFNKFYINKNVFIPRKDTEYIIEFLLNYLNYKNKYNILDICTGSGSIAISLANENYKFNILGTDVNINSINLAKYNKKNLSKYNNIKFKYSNLYKNINDKFDIILSNPPYLSYKEFIKLKLFDPIESLVSFNNGIGIIYNIIKYSKKYLNNNGILLIEHSDSQSYIVNNIFKKYLFSKVISINDLNNKKRFTLGSLL